jgi:two-component system cell cycle response regulator
MLDYALERCKRYQETLSVLMLDVDFFKQINDTYGHMTGDKVLTAVAAAIKQSIRTVDIAGRYGGEEFIVILPNIDIEGAAIVAERLRQAILEIRIEGSEIEASASFGVSSYAENDDTEFLVNRADLALYKSKRNGRNRVTAG